MNNDPTPTEKEEDGYVSDAEETFYC